MRIVLMLVCVLLATPAGAVTVFAAASLTNALQDAVKSWPGHPVRLVFGSSSTLAKQIEQGAPADLFFSADEKWMDDAAAKHAILPDTRRDLLGNSLVLVTHARATAVVMGPTTDFAALLGGGRLAVGDPAHVPAGIYAEQALKSLGWWDRLRGRLAPAADVRAALHLVETGDAPAGIVYATDARVAQVSVAGTFPAASHEPIRYPIAAVAAGNVAEARDLLAFLASPAAMAVFYRYGFTAP